MATTAPRSKSPAHHLQSVVRLHARASTQLRRNAARFAAEIEAIDPADEDARAKRAALCKERDLALLNAELHEQDARETALLLARRDVCGGGLLSLTPGPVVTTIRGLGTRRLDCGRRPATRRTTSSASSRGDPDLGDEGPGHRPPFREGAVA